MCKHLKEPFLNHGLAKEIIESARFLRREKKFLIYCYCLMPDHFHISLSPSIESGSVSKILQSFKSYTTQIGWRYGIIGELWQKSFYDHIARKGEDLIEIYNYILYNPVRKGLVEKPEDWPFSGVLDPLPV